MNVGRGGAELPFGGVPEGRGHEDIPHAVRFTCTKHFQNAPGKSRKHVVPSAHRKSSPIFKIEQRVIVKLARGALERAKGHRALLLSTAAAVTPGCMGRFKERPEKSIKNDKK